MVEPYTPAIDEMLMMAPPEGWSIICLPAHLQPKKVPLRLMPTTVFQPLAEMSSTLARKDAPALLIMTSRRPISFTVRPTRSFTCSSWRTSRATQKERRPRLLISAGDRPPVGPAPLRELHPDLVARPGPEAQPEQAALAAGGEDAVVGDRDAPAFGCAHPEHPVLREPALERALLAGGSALDQRPVDALHAAGLELGLERPLHGLGLGEHEQARRLAIEPGDDEGAGLLRPMLFPQVGPDQPL